ncbi:50S ribosomal protein L25 [Patescibacteria group bacterium]|nr:50S ribosomal protein L25 [Patescibacteria group bacterium]
MSTLALEVQTRTNDNSGEVRRGGLIPAAFYGPGKTNQSFVMDYQTFRKTYEKAGGNTVLELDIDGKSKEFVLVHDVQYDPITDRFIHVDFLHIDMNKETNAEVPLVFVGESKAIRDEAGILMVNRDVLEVRCLAKSIPHEIEVDISSLVDFNHSIHIRDIKLPEGVEAVDDIDLTIATVSAPREEKEEAPVEAVAAEGAVVEGDAAKAGEAKSE